MCHASRGKRSDYASYHEVRKAGQKVQYMLDFFEPLLAKKQLKNSEGAEKASEAIWRAERCRSQRGAAEQQFRLVRG
jgi:CHAD domain-containing protein